MLTIINELMKSEQYQKNPVARAAIVAFKKYIEQGGKLSALPWFKGLNFEIMEIQPIEKVA